MHEPLQLASATATLADQAVNVTSFSAEFKDGPAVSGSVSFPLRCGSPETCMLRFDLHTPEIDADSPESAVQSGIRKALRGTTYWTIGQRDENALLKLRALGRITAGRALWRSRYV